MTAKSLGAGAAGMLAAAAVAIAWRAMRADATAEASLADLNRQTGGSVATVERAQARLHDLSQKGRALDARFRAAGGKPEPKDARVARSSPRPDPLVLTVSDPNLRKLYLESLRARLPERYRAMFQALGFSPAQIAKFEDLAASHADDRLTAEAAGRAQGLKPDDAGLQAIETQTDNDFYARVSEDLGPAAAEAVRQVARLQDASGLVQGVARNVLPGTPPLTADQATQLTAILANASPSYRAGGNVNAATIDWNEADRQAATILSGSQNLAWTWISYGQVRQMLKEYYASHP
ncbi:MAG TPA: hypothetical protein VHV47_15275 [Opitutaceae bacterium]|jgi:hypothetical protein|nr:hypothetical protein [Opitutaceae bacterium]